ncbi:MAG: glycerol-3-phosphate 1-O-acyltransferase PlsY [Candidatus Gastranaerophilales bacterium]|nr:glycerol-3-phosphate 1-O-acyltransferase PlsY [Candidatus Gastranaerophilales bacterium]
MIYAIIFATVLVAYIIGSIPTGYILVKSLKGIDLRTVGSGSTGATNVKRVLGLKYFIITMLLDGFKGIIPVMVAKIIALKFGLPSVLAPLVGIAIILGHSKSVFLNFSGGKSVASGAGTVIGLDWHAGLLTFLIWFSVTYTSRYVSLGSIVALALSPVWMYLFHQPLSYILYCTVGAIYVIYLHRENIKRLIKGEENKVR